MVNTYISEKTQYRKATDVFHQFSDGKNIYGFQFGNVAESEAFYNSFAQLLESLSQMKASASNFSLDQRKASTGNSIQNVHNVNSSIQSMNYSSTYSSTKIGTMKFNPVSEQMSLRKQSLGNIVNGMQSQPQSRQSTTKSVTSSRNSIPHPSQFNTQHQQQAAPPVPHNPPPAIPSIQPPPIATPSPPESLGNQVPSALIRKQASHLESIQKQLQSTESEASMDEESALEQTMNKLKLKKRIEPMNFSTTPNISNHIPASVSHSSLRKSGSNHSLFNQSLNATLMQGNGTSIHDLLNQKEEESSPSKSQLKDPQLVILREEILTEFRRQIDILRKELGK